MKFKIKYKIFISGMLEDLENQINYFCDEKDNDDYRYFVEHVDIKRVSEEKYFYAVIRYSEITKDGEVNENDK